LRYTIPILCAGGHHEAVRIVGRISRLVEGRGCKVILACPPRQRFLAPPICTVMVTGATAARARWAWSRVVKPLLLEPHW